MTRFLSWLHCPPMGMLVVAAIFLGLAPFTPEPHLLQKLHMLQQGELHRPIDIFDVFWHGWPIIWIVVRLLTPGAAGQCPVSKSRDR